jgi:hypothetical protein
MNVKKINMKTSNVVTSTEAGSPVRFLGMRGGTFGLALAGVIVVRGLGHLDSWCHPGSRE